jgi:hypothetical protein
MPDPSMKPNNGAFQPIVGVVGGCGQVQADLLCFELRLHPAKRSDLSRWIENEWESGQSRQELERIGSWC